MNIQTLNQYKDQGLLVNQFHPAHPLIIWNYTPKVQYEALWDDITIQCRGLVTDLDGAVISKGFSKFFNIEENRHIPTDDFEIFEKLDGQYIGVFWYNGEMVVNSKGSFTSPYVLEANRILEEKYPKFKECLEFSYSTFCFELIGFEQIVVSYPESDLILTGIFQMDYEILLETDAIPKISNLIIVKKFNGFDYTRIKQLNWQNKEGFVVRFSNGSRCKIKFEDYIKFHRQMTNLSTTAIWEALKEGKPVSTILNDVPDEFFEKVHEYETQIKIEYMNIRIDCESDFIRLGEKAFDKKTFADYIKDHPQKNILFSMYDDKDYSHHIWKQIKPEFKKI